MSFKKKKQIDILYTPAAGLWSTVGTVIQEIPDVFQNLLRCSWSTDGSKIAAGSADRCHTHTQTHTDWAMGITYTVDLICFLRFVYIWDTTSRRILYKLPGHAGSVNEVTFHPEEPVGESNSCFYSKALRGEQFYFMLF